VVDGIDQREQLGRLVALAERGKAHDRPGSGMSVLAAILADAGRIALDIAGMQRGLVERRGKQQCQTVAAMHEVVSRAAIARTARVGSPAPDIAAQDWAMESMRHSSLSAEPSGVPSS